MATQSFEAFDMIPESVCIFVVCFCAASAGNLAGMLFGRYVVIAGIEAC